MGREQTSRQALRRRRIRALFVGCLGLVGVAGAATPVVQDSPDVVSPDGRWAAFVRTDPTRSIDTTALGDAVPAQSLMLRERGQGEPRLLLSAGSACGDNPALNHLQWPQFLADGRRLVFASAWLTVEGSIHVLDVVSGECRQLGAGNSLQVVPRGPYRDHLIVMRHQYFLGGGAYDWYWLLDPEGKPIGPIGDSEDSVERFLEEQDDAAAP